MYTSNDVIHVSFLTFIDALAILSNLVLILAIIKRTPRAMRAYSMLLLNSALLDISSAVISFLTIIRIVNVPGALLYIFLGPCTYVSHQFCHILHGIHAHFLTQSSMLLFLSFSYRLWALPQNATDRTSMSASPLKIWLVSLTTTIPNAASIFAHYRMGDVPEEVLNDPAFANYTMTTLSTPFSTYEIVSIAYLCLSSPSIILFIYFVRRELIRRISDERISNKVHHKTIIKALTVQMFLPAAFSIGCTFWFLEKIGVYSAEWAQRGIMTTASLLALVAPYITMIFIKPYRTFVLSRVTRRHSEMFFTRSSKLSTVSESKLF